jgi:Flp pilus assembly pilin Flp
VSKGTSRVLRRLVRDQGGQDLIEYGLLAAAVAATGFALFPSILTSMAAMFQSWAPAVNSIWEPSPPF